MKFKKITALAAAAAMAAGMTFAVPASAATTTTKINLDSSPVAASAGSRASSKAADGSYEWSIDQDSTNGVTVYFYIGQIDFDKLTEISLRVGHGQSNTTDSATYDLYYVDTNGVALTGTDLQASDFETKNLSDTNIIASVTTQNTNWDYSTINITKNNVALGDNTGSNYRITASSNLTVPENTGTNALVMKYTMGTGHKAYFDYVNIVYNEETSVPVAKIGDKEYTKLDDALAYLRDTGENNPVDVLSNTEITVTGCYNKDGSKSVTVQSADNETKTVTLNTTGSVFMWDNVTFDKINITGNAESLLKSGNDSKQGTFNFKNASITNVSCNSHLSNFGANNLTNAELTGITTGDHMIYARNSGELTKAKITGNTANNGNKSIIYLTNKDVDIALTVTDSNITGNTAASDIQIVPSASKKVTVNLAGSTTVGKIDNSSTTTSDADIVLKNGFTGSAEIKTASTAVDTVVATVEEGAKTEGITVTDLYTNTYELQNIDGSLTIKKKTVAAPSGTLVEANFESTKEGYTTDGNTLSDGTNIVYGYMVDLTGNGTAYNTVKADVKAADGNSENTVTFTGATASGEMKVTFYIVANKALNCSESRIYCE